MNDRCYRAKNSQFKYYGERGVTVCDRWRKSFENFLNDMGESPHGLTIERIDTNGNYCPKNCKWATPTEQANNKRNNRHITFDGQTKTHAEWERHLGLKECYISNRLSIGWTIERIFKS